MNNASNTPVKVGPSTPTKVKFTWEHVYQWRGIINRHNRRRYNKLSRMGKLMSNDVPEYFLYETKQAHYAID